MSKELEAFERIKTTRGYECEELHYWMDDNDIAIVENGLKRLEAIDNANPSEALEKLQNLRLYQCSACEHHNCSKCDVYKDFNAVNKYLLKAQEPKHYLKWEDLEFNHTPKYIDVKMNDNKYKLVVGYNVAGKNLAILRDGKKEYYFLECDKQFFNDLRLERVEE